MALTPEQKKSLKTAGFVDDKDFALFEEIQELNEKLDFLKHLDSLTKLDLSGIELIKGKDGEKPQVGVDFEQPKDGDDGHTPKEGIDFHVPTVDEVVAKIPVPKDGKTPDDEKLVSLIKPIVDSIEIPIPEIEIPEHPSPEEHRDALEALQGDNRLDKSAIKGLEDLFEKVDKFASRPSGTGAVGARDLVVEIDISDQLDGSTKTFNTPATWKILTVDLSSFPHALRKTVDYTYTPTSITFTSEIDAGTSLATGQTCIITAVSA